MRRSTNGSASSSRATWKQTAAACLQGWPWSGQEQRGTRSPGPGSRRTPDSATVRGSSLANSAVSWAGSAAMASSRSVHSPEESSWRRITTLYGRGRLPRTVAAMRPGVMLIVSTLPSRAYVRPRARRALSRAVASRASSQALPHHDSANSPRAPERCGSGGNVRERSERSMRPGAAPRPGRAAGGVPGPRPKRSASSPGRGRGRRLMRPSSGRRDRRAGHRSVR